MTLYFNWLNKMFVLKVPKNVWAIWASTLPTENFTKFFALQKSAKTSSSHRIPKHYRGSAHSCMGNGCAQKQPLIFVGNRFKITGIKGNIPWQLLFKAKTCHNLPRQHPYGTHPVSGCHSLFGAQLLLWLLRTVAGRSSGDFPWLLELQRWRKKQHGVLQCHSSGFWEKLPYC